MYITNHGIDYMLTTIWNWITQKQLRKSHPSYDIAHRLIKNMSIPIGFICDPYWQTLGFIRNRISEHLKQVNDPKAPTSMYNDSISFELAVADLAEYFKNNPDGKLVTYRKYDTLPLKDMSIFNDIPHIHMMAFFYPFSYADQERDHKEFAEKIIEKLSRCRMQEILQELSYTYWWVQVPNTNDVVYNLAYVIYSIHHHKDFESDINYSQKPEVRYLQQYFDVVGYIDNLNILAKRMKLADDSIVPYSSYLASL